MGRLAIGTRLGVRTPRSQSRRPPCADLRAPACTVPSLLESGPQRTGASTGPPC